MSKAPRALAVDFLETMNLHNAWPKVKRFEEWVRKERAETVRNGVISSMMKGIPVDPKHVASLAAYFLMILENRPDDPTAMTVRKYLKSRGKNSSMSSEMLAEVLLATETDPFFSGFDGMIDSLRCKVRDAVSGRAIIKTYVRECGDSDVPFAADWLYVWAAKDLYPQKKYASADEAIAATEAAIGLTREEFTDLARQWKSYDEWTIILAQGKYVPTGMSVVLPLRLEAYEAIREGKKGLSDITPSDLVRPSKNLLVVAIAQRPAMLGGDSGNTLKTVCAAHLSQVSILSATKKDGAGQSLRLLALVGTPQNGSRAELSGYKSLGIVSPGHRFQVYERVFGERLSIEDTLLLGFSRYLAQYAADFLRPPHPPEEGETKEVSFG